MKITIGALREKEALLDKVDRGVNDKLTYAVKRLSSSIEKVTKPIQDEVQDSITDYCVDKASVDEVGNLIVVDNLYAYTPKGKKEVQKFTRAENERFLKMEVDVEPFLVDINKPGFERAKVLFDDFDVEELTGLLFEGNKGTDD